MPKQKVRKAIIADAGYSTRFLPITKTLPKSMLPLMDKPITHHLIEECMEAGITEIIIVATKEGKPIYEDYFHNTVQHIYRQLAKQGKQERFNKIRKVFELPGVIVISQDKNLPYGTASPILSSRQYIGKDEPFLFIQADDLVIGESACKELVEEYENSDDDVVAIIASIVDPTKDITKYGVVELKEGTENELARLIEKPTLEEAPTDMISFGRFLFTSKYFDYVSGKEDELGKDGELWNADTVDRMAKAEKVLVKKVSGRWQTTGDPVNYLKTVIDFALEDPEYNGDFVKYLGSLGCGCGDKEKGDDDHNCKCGHCE